MSSGTKLYTVWNIETREAVFTGSCAVGKEPLIEGDERIHWGEKVDHVTYIFGDEDIPVLRGIVPIPTLTEEISVAINRERQRRIEAGKDFGGVWVTGSDRDQVNLLALKDTARDLVEAGVTAAVIPFRDGNNVEHMLAAEQVIDIANAGKMYVSAIYQASWAFKAMEPIPQDVTNDQYWP